MSRKNAQRQFCGRMNRRESIGQIAGGFAGLALTGMLSGDNYFSRGLSAAEPGRSIVNPYAERPPMVPAKVKSVIFIFCYGGPSAFETFEYKPNLYPLDGKTIQIKTFGRGGKRNEGRVVGPKWKFKHYGKSGKLVSDLFPNLGTCVDDITFLHSMTADSPIHGSAMLMMNCGSIISGKPSLGSWLNYGLGTVNQNLPGYVVMLDSAGGPISGAKNWTSGYMPSAYQGTLFRSEDPPILDLENARGLSRAQQRTLLEGIQKFNAVHLSERADSSELRSRIASYELAYKMQAAAPEAIDVDSEPEYIKRLYGLDQDRTAEFARKFILARRLVERGVRFVQVYSGGGHSDNNWDAHNDMVKNHTYHAGRTDKPLAGLLKDLKQRGMLDETLIVWGGEFGRQPVAEYAQGTGRDHNSFGFTMWMAGGGLRSGMSYGQTDELGNRAVENPTHVRRLHATILTQMGLDPNDLTFFYGGLDQKLVGPEHVEPIWDIMA